MQECRGIAEQAKKRKRDMSLAKVNDEIAALERELADKKEALRQLEADEEPEPEAPGTGADSAV